MKLARIITILALLAVIAGWALGGPASSVAPKAATVAAITADDMRVHAQRAIQVGYMTARLEDLDRQIKALADQRDAINAQRDALIKDMAAIEAKTQPAPTPTPVPTPKAAKAQPARPAKGGAR